jgi:hypothetical protein
MSDAPVKIQRAVELEVRGKTPDFKGETSADLMGV